MKKNNWIVFAVLVGVIAMIFLVIDWRMALSFLLGSAAAVLTYLLTARYCDLALSLRSSGGTMGHFALNYMIWAAVLVICAVLPQYFNVLTCALGLVMVKISLVLGEFVKKKE